MTTEPSTDPRAAILLHERAVRQALVDRLVSRSEWSRLIDILFLPAVAGALYLLIPSAWLHEQGRLGDGLLAGGLAVVCWLVMWLVQTTRRLQAVTTVLQKSGALSQFVAEAGAPAKIA